MELSFSRVSSFDNCKYGFYLTYKKECGTCRYYDEDLGQCENKSCIFFARDVERDFSCSRHRPYYKRENAFAQSGSFFHELMEYYSKGILTSEELPLLYENYFDMYVTEDFPPNKFTNLYDRYKDGATQFLLQFEGFQKYEVVGSELSFSYPVGEDASFRGIIDLLLRDPEDGEYIIADYKSKAEFKSADERKRYARQLYLYSNYVRNTYGKFPKKLVFVHFRTHKTTEIAFNQLDHEEAVEWLYKKKDEIREEQTYPHHYDSFFCNNICDYRATCKRKDSECHDR